MDVEVDVDFGFFGILDVDVSVGGGIHPHIQHPKKSGCRPLLITIKNKVMRSHHQIFFEISRPNIMINHLKKSMINFFDKSLILFFLTEISNIS